MPPSRPTLHGAVFGVLRRLLGLTEVEAAQALGTTRKVVTHFEGGATRTRLPGRLREMGGGLGYQPVHVQLVLRSLALAVAGRKEERPTAALGLAAGELRCAAAQGEMELATAKTVGAGLRPNRAVRKAVKERQQIEALCRRLLAAKEKPQEALVRIERDFWSPDVVARLCELSIQAAGTRPKEMLRVSRLALAAATRCSAEIRAAVEGYARFFVANALRVLSRLHEAEAENARAWQLWEAPSGRRPPELAAWRPLELTVSLRCDQERWEEALAFSQRCVEQAPASRLPRILVKKSHVLIEMGAFERALAALLPAREAILSCGELRLALGFHFNLARSCHGLGRAAEAERHLGSAWAAAEELGNALDLNRCLWLRGLIAAQQGRAEEAAACLAQARREYARRGLALSAAAVTLDQAILHLERGDTAKVRTLAAEAAGIFKASGIPRETLVALKTFADAVQRDAATVALAREVRGAVPAGPAGAARRLPPVPGGETTGTLTATA